MKCPYCNKQTLISQTAFLNLEQYGGSCKVITGCCGKIVWLCSTLNFKVLEYTGDATEDDWGKQVKKTKLNTTSTEINITDVKKTCLSTSLINTN